MGRNWTTFDKMNLYRKKAGNRLTRVRLLERRNEELFQRLCESQSTVAAKTEAERSLTLALLDAQQCVIKLRNERDHIRALHPCR